jgi:group I intron endonuclease
MICKEKILRFKSGVYKITNIINNKCYVGSSINIYNRFHTHRNKLKNKTHSSQHLTNSYHKYGDSNFQFEILEYCINITEREQYWINKLKPEYNKREIAQNNLGRKVSQETKSKISKTLKEKNNYLKNNGLSTLNPKNEDKSVKVNIYDITGKYITTVNSFKKAALFLNNFNLSSAISRICKRNHGLLHNYQFRYYVNNTNDIDFFRKKGEALHYFKNEKELKVFKSCKEIKEYFNVKNISLTKVYKNKKYRDYEYTRVLYKSV